MREHARRSIREVQDEIVREVAALGDGLERYQYLVALGRELPVPEEDIRTDENALGGCQTTVWIRARMYGGALHFLADSDAMITRGILALLLRVVDGRPPSEVAATDLYFLDDTGLKAHLSPSRTNGLAGIVDRIRSHAEEHAVEPGSAGGGGRP